jgi:hypothetical protein
MKAAAIKNDLVREKDDFYSTPAWCTRAVLRRLRLPSTAIVLDPCAGDGAILAVVKEFGFRGIGSEIDKERAQLCECEHEDFLAVDHSKDLVPEMLGGSYSVVTNPPSKLAFEFVTKCVYLHPKPKHVAMLLPINWLASQKRHCFLRDHTPALWVLSKRPAFLNGTIAACDYAWFVWSRRVPATVEILPLEPSC